MTDQKNTILAIVLSALVLIAWQYFVGMPQMEKQRQDAQLKQQQAQTQQQQPGQPAPQTGAQPGAQPSAPSVPGQPAAAPAQVPSRETVVAASPRVTVETPQLKGSISLRGGRIDDLALTKYPFEKKKRSISR
jgi:YidC/Oxa1 family membrane protein insertase